MIPKVFLPQGFLASGINSGVRRYRPDLGIILSESPAKAAGTFTLSTLKAAPVAYSSKLLPSSSIRAIICNSGQANAATGQDGIDDNQRFVEAAARNLNLEPQEILVASTGVIGVRLPLDILIPAIPQASKAFNNTINSFSLAIMTTDLVPKFFSKEVKLSGGSIVITGAAKGSGMIHPNMGTMLGFVLTDADVDADWFNKEVKDTVEESFNMISVDGETSTNDTFFALANGASKVPVKGDEDKKLFSEAFREVATELAIAIARDGEGASKLITVHVLNAPSLQIARDSARAITTSPLIKSAMHGEDPNWGRILARLGYAGVPPEIFSKLSLDLQQTRVYDQGRPLAFDRSRARAELHEDSIEVKIDLKSGSHRATAWGCDLTKRYVEINTEYS